LLRKQQKTLGDYFFCHYPVVVVVVVVCAGHRVLLQMLIFFFRCLVTKTLNRSSWKFVALSEIGAILKTMHQNLRVFSPKILDP